MWYLDKKGILEHLGKDKKDTRWVDRAISKGVVWKDSDTGAYILCTEYIEELEEENVKLKIKAGEIEGYHCIKDGEPDLGVREKRYYELKALYDNLVKEKEVDKNDNQKKAKEKVGEKKVDKNINSDNDLVDHLRLLYQFNEAKQNAINELVQLYYNKNTSGGWDNAVEKTYGMIKYSENPLENDELEYVKSLIS